MIQPFVDRFMANEAAVKARFAEKHPDSYGDIVRAVIEAITNGELLGSGSPDPERIHAIDDGSYQGTLVFVIAETGYQPDDYWYVKVDYGSCSGCDTLEAIQDHSGDSPTSEQVDDYWTLALHVVQGLKLMGGDPVW